MRELDGRSVEQVAPLAGLTASEWEDIEAGQAPSTVEQVYWLATALRLGRSWRKPLVSLCAAAQEK
jgi:hypothetical protein